MKNIVKRVAHDFIYKELKGKNDISAITVYLQSKGYTIALYDNEEEDALITEHDLDERVKIVHAFTIVDGNSKTVCVNSSLSAENKVYSIAHETGHIVLGHLDSEAIIVSSRLQEMEAEAFAYEVLTYKKSFKRFYLVLAILISALVLAFCISFVHDVCVVETIDLSTQVNDIVYITPSGDKYHRESCMYVKRTNSTAVTEFEAKRTHEPCLVCNP